MSNAEDCEQYCSTNNCCTCRNREWYRLYEDYKKLKAELEQEKNWHKTSDEISKANSKYTAKLKQALKEIKEIAEKGHKEKGNLMRTWWFKDILQKISEVIDETNTDNTV